MLKRTIYCENPSYIKLKDKQFCVEFKDKTNPSFTATIEDIGFLIIDNSDITITSKVLQELQEHKIGIVICDKKHMPAGLMLPIDGNYIQQERMELQAKAKHTLKNILWKQIIYKKIQHQAFVLNTLSINSDKLKTLSQTIKSGDKTNREAIASAYYWKYIFKQHTDRFIRDRYGKSPNNLLNYGYTIIRSVMARTIVSCGLSPTLGLFHKNKFNAFTLADDLMEPFRPFVDKIVCDMIESHGLSEDLTQNQKELLLNIPSMEVVSKEETTSLMLATSNIVNSYIHVLEKKQETLDFPEFKL